MILDSIGDVTRKLILKYINGYNEPWFQNYKYSEGFFYVEITQYFILKQC